MKKFFIVTGILMLFSFVSMGMAAEEKATKEECVAKCNEAAKMVKEIGLKATLEKINDPNGPFRWKDSYVLCIELDTGILLAHPFVKKPIGTSVKGWRDKKGKLFVVEYLNIGKFQGEGWGNYMWPKPGETKASPKTTYVYRVPDENVIVMAGYYE